MSKSYHISSDISVDAQGLNCPLPILKARKALMTMQAGQILKVTATDPTSAEDFPVFAEATGNELFAQEQQGTIFHYYLRVGNASTKK